MIKARLKIGPFYKARKFSTLSDGALIEEDHREK